jgi:hypothetical protein
MELLVIISYFSDAELSREVVEMETERTVYHKWISAYIDRRNDKRKYPVIEASGALLLLV